MFKKLVMPLATTRPATESPGSTAAKPCADRELGAAELLQFT